MRKFTTIAAGKYDEDSIYLISEGGGVNCISLHDGEEKSELISWKGKAVTGGCLHNGCFFVTTSGPLIYIVDGAEVETWDLSRYGFDGIKNGFNSIDSFNDELLIGVGDRGRIYFLDCSSFDVTEKRISSIGISKPGRDFHGLYVLDEGRSLLCGDKRLLIEVGNGGVRDVGCSISDEECYFSISGGCGALWLSGIRGWQPILTKFCGQGEFFVFEAPTDHHRAPSVLVIEDGRLLLAGRKVFIGEPGSWSMIHDCEGELVVKLVPSPADAYKVFCVMINGEIAVVSLRHCRKPTGEL